MRHAVPFLSDRTHSHPTHILMTHNALICPVTRSQRTWLIPMRDKTISYVTQPIYARHDSFVCDMTHSHVIELIYTSRTSFTSEMTRSHATWLIPILHDSFMYDMTHLYMTRLTHLQYNSFTANMTRSYMTWRIHTWHDSFPCDMADFCGSVARIHSSKYQHSQNSILSYSTCVHILTQNLHDNTYQDHLTTHIKNIQNIWEPEYTYICTLPHTHIFFLSYLLYHHFHVHIFRFWGCRFSDINSLSRCISRLCIFRLPYSGSHIQAPIFIFLYSNAVAFQTPTLCYDYAYSGSHIQAPIFSCLNSFMSVARMRSTGTLVCCVTAALFHMRDMTHSIWHDSFLCAMTHTCASVALMRSTGTCVCRVMTAGEWGADARGEIGSALECSRWSGCCCIYIHVWHGSLYVTWHVTWHVTWRTRGARLHFISLMQYVTRLLLHICSYS